jgi:hypothetical protein
MFRSRALAGVVSFVLVACHCAHLAAQSLADVESAATKLESLLPADAPAFTTFDTRQVDDAARQLERACALLSETRISPGRSPVAPCQALFKAKSRADAQLDRLLTLRGNFAALPADPSREEAARAYLRTVSRMIDLTGRLRYVQFDALNAAAAVAEGNAEWNEALIESAINARSVAAANSWNYALAPSQGREGPATFSAARVLDLCAAAPDPSHLPPLVEYLRTPGLSSRETLQTIETIRAVGLPQDPRPQDGKDGYQPMVLAAEMHERLNAIDAGKLSEDEKTKRSELLAWLAERRDQGIMADSYRMGDVEVRPGDWLLMRNPSPYNHFATLSPGLFTHVGVITDETGPDGKRRIVVVDLPERGDRMPATNFDTFILRTLHYVVMRHPDPAVAERMADVARTLIDTPTEFDLNFNTSRVTALRGQIEPGVKVKTYCAGLLLVCAQETPLERAAFFPFSESVAGGNTAKNLATLGLSIGEDFISPTGPLFSPTMQLAARREALYEPGREIREAVYDHFAAGLAEKTLTSAPNLQQSLRIRMAEMAKGNPLLAEAIARTNQVSAELDLVAAAKAAAVVESLDEVANTAAESFAAARDAIRAGNARTLRREGLQPAEIRAIEAARRPHQQLMRQWESGELSPRELREALVKHYVTRGKQALDERFFSAPESR